MDMNKISEYRQQMVHLLEEPNLRFLANFNDNHDNPRFLNDLVGNNYLPPEKHASPELKLIMFKAITAFCLTNDGIPIIYYGSEQAFAGGNDPYNRETLWSHMDT